jgi:putative aldouronate transport system permease protein
MKKYSKSIGFNIFNMVILAIVALTTLFPLYYVLVTSLTTQGDYLQKPLMLYPMNINLDSYEYILSNKNTIRSIFNSSFITIAGTLYSMVLTLSCAYVLMNKYIKGINFLFKLVIFTMFFNGGLIPYYLTIKNLGLYDSLLALILPHGINTFYMIIVLNALREVPESLRESARIDGANDIIILIKIYIPLIVPTVMCITLFYIVDKWNEWYSAMLFIKTSDRYPISYLLRSIVVQSSQSFITVAEQQINRMRPKYTVGIQRAAIIISIIPIIIIYPFLQKYFAKGIMIGSVKG